MDLTVSAKSTAFWFAIDMAAPTFAHEADDFQASIAEMAVAKATRPSPQEIIDFAIALEQLILDWDFEKDGAIILSTKYEPEGILADAIRLSGRSPNVHHLSWFSRMKITRDGVVHLSKYQDSKGAESWMVLFGSEAT